VVMAPADENECRRMLYTGFQLNQPAAVRYPRGKGPGVTPEREMRALPVGKAEIRRRGRDLALLAFGSMVGVAEAVAKRLDATVVNMRWAKPIDEALLREVAERHDALVTLEEGAILGGAGSAVCEALNAMGILRPVLQLGLPDAFQRHASREDLLAEAGIDAAGIRAAVLKRWPHLAAASQDGLPLAAGA